MIGIGLSFWRGAGGLRISFPSAAVLDNSTIGTVVGTATVVGGATTGTAVWSLSNSAGGKYVINSSTGVVTVAAGLAAGTDTITIAVSGLSPVVPNASFPIPVTSSASAALKTDFSTPNTTEAWVFW